jgi:hypothetical protein
VSLLPDELIKGAHSFGSGGFDALQAGAVISSGGNLCAPTCLDRGQGRFESHNQAQQF